MYKLLKADCLIWKANICLLLQVGLGGCKFIGNVNDSSTVSILIKCINKGHFSTKSDSEMVIHVYIQTNT